MRSPDDNRRRSRGTPTAIPLAVRRKLVEAARDLSAEDWQRLPAAARRRLEHMPCESGTHRRTFATLIDWLRLTFITPGRATTLRPAPPAPGTLAWRMEHPPEAVAHVLASAALDWAELDIDQRYGLVEAASEAEPCALERYVDALVSTLRRDSVVA